MNLASLLLCWTLETIGQQSGQALVSGQWWALGESPPGLAWSLSRVAAGTGCYFETSHYLVEQGDGQHLANEGAIKHYELNATRAPTLGHCQIIPSSFGK